MASNGVEGETSADRNVEIWKIKKLIKSLEAARGLVWNPWIDPVTAKQINVEPRGRGISVENCPRFIMGQTDRVVCVYESFIPFKYTVTYYISEENEIKNCFF